MSKEPKQENQPGDQPPGMREMLDAIHELHGDKSETARRVKRAAMANE
jgi:hypothetical protein